MIRLHLPVCCGLLLGLPGLAAPPPAVASSAPWLSADWGYRMEITAVADSLPSTGTLSDFPLLLRLDAGTHPDVFGHAKADGTDLLVTKSDGVTPLDREVVGYDTGTGEAEVWVRADSLSGTVNRFYLYYGNPDTSLAPASPGTWGPEYRVIYHFDDNPGAGLLTDSSPQGADITLDPAWGWTSADTIAGRIGQAWLFNGTTHYLNTRSISTQDSSYAISSWLLHNSYTTDFALQAEPGFWHISSQIDVNSNRPDYAINGVQVRFEPEVTINSGFHLFTWVFDAVADTILFYYDGESQAVNSIYNPNHLPIYTGSLINPLLNTPVGVLGPEYFNNLDVMTGGADEFRIREGVPSPDRVRTEYRNQKYPGQFLTFGVEETANVTGVDPDPVESGALRLSQNSPNPFTGRTSVRFSTGARGHVSLSVFDVAGREVARLLDADVGPGPHETRWDGRAQNGLDAPSGVYFLRLETGREVSTVKLQLRR